MEGHGKMIITAVGIHSENGTIVSFCTIIHIIYSILDVSVGCSRQESFGKDDSKARKEHSSRRNH